MACHQCLPFVSLVAPTVVEPVTPGCTTNSDCPDYTACRNTQCINPCAVDAPCAPTANCKVISHQPVCTCPDGYIGSPTTECRLRKNVINLQVTICYLQVTSVYLQLKVVIYKLQRVVYNLLAIIYKLQAVI